MRGMYRGDQEAVGRARTVHRMLLPKTNVTIILVMTETRSLADVKAHLSEIVDLVESQHERVVITRHGRPAAVIVSPADLESIEETLGILSAPGALEEIHAAEHEVARGQFLTAAELRAKYLTKE